MDLREPHRDDLAAFKRKESLPRVLLHGSTCQTSCRCSGSEHIAGPCPTLSRLRSRPMVGGLVGSEDVFGDATASPIIAQQMSALAKSGMSSLAVWEHIARDWLPPSYADFCKWDVLSARVWSPLTRSNAD